MEVYDRVLNLVYNKLDWTMTQHTSRLWKGYLTKKERDGGLHQITWPPHSSDLNPNEMVWDELDRRVKEKQSTSVQHMWELLQDCWKSILGEAG
uniref:Tc1-like transposase DDE domain-containing protein n=1 Tax=Hucho hucho TaxID=62062 RepID=A0A4W5L7H0_9TELE